MGVPTSFMGPSAHGLEDADAGLDAIMNGGVGARKARMMEAIPSTRDVRRRVDMLAGWDSSCRYNGLLSGYIRLVLLKISR